MGDIGRAGDDGVVGLEDGWLIPAPPNGFAGVTAGEDGLEDDLEECEEDALTGLALDVPGAAGELGAVRDPVVAEPNTSNSGDRGIPSGIGIRPEMLTLRLALRLADCAAFSAASSSDTKASIPPSVAFSAASAIDGSGEPLVGETSVMRALGGFAVMTPGGMASNELVASRPWRENSKSSSSSSSPCIPSSSSL